MSELHVAVSGTKVAMLTQQPPCVSLELYMATSLQLKLGPGLLERPVETAWVHN